METLIELKRYLDTKKKVFFEHLFEIGSTNTYLKEKNQPMNDQIFVALADKQNSGRGRSGRSWYSPDSGNLYISFKFKLKGKLAPISLIVASEISKIIFKLSDGMIVTSIKWPNDIMLVNKKVSGILVETENDNEGFIYIVGVGVNFVLPEKKENHWGVVPITQKLNRYSLSKELCDCMLNIINNGTPDDWQVNWESVSFHANKKINLTTNSGEKVSGDYQGITKNGSLLVQTEDGLLKEFASGECSLNY